MKKWVIGIMVAVFLASASSWVWAEKRVQSSGSPQATTGEYPSGTIVAFSLKVLQQRLKASPETLRKGEVMHLAGVTKINGYVIDEANHDLILFGEVNPNWPPLYLDDFVVALRNAWLKYATLKGNTYYYSDPGCSIDPNPKVIHELEEIGNQINRRSSIQEINQEIQNWHRVCRSPQQVRVLGIPFNTRFAWVMVKADYDMKQLVDGSDVLDIPGFTSLTEMTMELSRNDVLAGRPISIPLRSMNRFWFHPEKNLYEEDQGVVVIKQSPVILLTEEEHLSKEGEIVGRGAPDPLAHRFAQNFSSQYNHVAQQRPIYSELENLFRFVALARIMKFKSADKEAGLNLSNLLNQYQVQPASVSPQLAGRSNVKEFQHRRDFAGGYQIARLWLPSCGGVGIEIKVSQSLFMKDRSGAITKLRAALLQARPSPEALFWPMATRE
ncbi:MAG: DUF1598 domain-containing protein [Deltaproteobacteria bacterium]|nr:MAG: DUF1598 domain-containing protein [Deltaproteobacteria bacterium]